MLSKTNPLILKNLHVKLTKLCGRSDVVGRNDMSEVWRNKFSSRN